MRYPPIFLGLLTTGKILCGRGPGCNIYGDALWFAWSRSFCVTAESKAGKGALKWEM
jgi:hypothetical protein